jgi:hypothetical protein
MIKLLSDLRIFPNIFYLVLSTLDIVGYPGGDISIGRVPYIETGGVMDMKRWVHLFLALVILSVFSLGCVGASKEIKTRCPKCAGYYETKGGEEEFRWMHGC